MLTIVIGKQTAIDKVVISNEDLRVELHKAQANFLAQNRRALRDLHPLIPQDSMDRLNGIAAITPVRHAIITAADNWVIITQKDNGRYPNDNEWHRFLTGSLNGKIGMSFALQWRYNFRGLFQT